MPSSRINPLSRCRRKLRRQRGRRTAPPLSRIPDVGLTLAGVVRFAAHAQAWTKLSDDEPFSQFQAEFWGKSMEDEEQEWVKTQTQDRSKDDDLDGGDDAMDDGDDDTGSMGNGDDMNDTNVDDEFTPGCYVLNTDNNPFLPEVPQIWIRADYIRVYKFIESRYDRCYSSRKAQAVVLTGHPGTGKTVLLLYALRRRFAERKPIIWYDGKDGYIFVEDGVYQMAPDFQLNHFKTFVWTLVDSDGAADGIPPHLVWNRTRLFVIYSTSPTRKRWERLHKTVDDVTVIMNPWTWSEILRVMPILLPGWDEVEVRKIFDQLAPTPRIIQLLSNPARLQEYKENVEMTILGITPDNFQQLVRNISSLSMEKDISNKLGLLRRQKRDDVHSRSVIEPITDVIKSRLASRFRRVAKDKQIELYELYSKVPQTRKMAGSLFESIQQGVFRDGLTIDILPMVRLTRNPNAKSRPCWYSSHTSLGNKTLEARRQEALQQLQKIEIHPFETEEFDTDIVFIREGVFYVPKSDNEEVLDSFIVIDGILYIFQFTIAGNHFIKPGFLTFFGKCQGIPPMEKWRFVFVIPPGLTMTCPEPPSLLRELHPYSAMVSIPHQK